MYIPLHFGVLRLITFLLFAVFLWFAAPHTSAFVTEQNLPRVRLVLIGLLALFVFVLIDGRPLDSFDR